MPDAAGLSHIIRAEFAPCSLGVWPTPLERAEALGRDAGLDMLWLKREDRSSPRYGGNKVRGLEFLLAGSGGTVCVTLGGTGSTHCLATAIHGRAMGLRTVLAQFPQPESGTARAVAEAARAHADVVLRARTRAALPLVLWRAWRAAARLGTRRWIPGGGAHPRAVLGHVLAALELEAQLDRAPDAVVVPLGTGGTAAGLVLGLGALGWPTRVVAVRVAPVVVANRWRVALLHRRAAGHLASRGWGPAERRAAALIVIDGSGRGYGHPTPEGVAAQRIAAAGGLLLDGTYGAKAFAALGSLAARGYRRAVFWHTFAPPPPQRPPWDGPEVAS